MYTSRLVSLSLLLSALATPAHGAGPLVPVDHFTDEDTYSQPRLSPDGKHLAINVRLERNGRMIPTMSVYSLPELKLVSTIALTGYEIPLNFLWLTNRRLVVKKGLEIGIRVAPVATGEVVAVDLDGTRPEYLYGYKAFTLSSKGERYGDDNGYANIAAIPEPSDGKVLLGAHQWDTKRSLLYEINSLNSNRKLLANIAMENLDFSVQNNGKPRFAAGTDEDNAPVVFRFDDASAQWRKLTMGTATTGYIPFGFTPDDRSAYVWYSAQGGPYEAVLEDLATGARRVLASDTVGNVQLTEFTAKPFIAFAARPDTGIPHARYLDENLPDAKLHRSLSAAFPDAQVHFINFSDDGQRLLFSVASDRDPGSYYLYDRQAGKADLLFTNMSKIDPERMAERKPISFTARDGMQLMGYLTLPANPDKARLPMVLLPHGGPFDVFDGWYFDTDAQFLASRGYAVLQVNFRGSGGRGDNFRAAGYRQFGGKMMDDLIDGVKWANALPGIDPDRVCVYGASFGGYAAMMLPVREPAMFKCAVGYAGRYHLPSRYTQHSNARDIKAKNYLIKTMGDDNAMLESISPTNLADRIKVPVLMVHGGNDKTTELKQAEMMRDALTRAGRPPEWMLEKDEGHGFYDAARRKAFFEKLEAFLGKHIGKAAGK